MASKLSEEDRIHNLIALAKMFDIQIQIIRMPKLFSDKFEYQVIREERNGGRLSPSTIAYGKNIEDLETKIKSELSKF